VNLPLRIALVGCGEVTEHKHLPALARVRDARVVALVDPNHARLSHVADRYGIPLRFSSTSALLDAQAADLVGVLTPPAQHTAPVLAALRAGCDVLVEKPLALAMNDADAMVEAADTTGRRVLMGFHMRWHRLIKRAREAIREGAVGTPESIRGIWNSPRGDAGLPPWKAARTTGGGALVELGVHLFDLWRFLLDTEVIDVSARSRHGHRHDESALVTGVLANGVIASAQMSERTSHEIELEICGDRGRLRVACQRFDGLEWYGPGETRGMVTPRLRGLLRTARELPRGLATMRRIGDYGDSYRGQWQHLVDAVRSGTSLSCSLEDGRAALRVVQAAAASASRGEYVQIAAAPRTITDATHG
jgi:UDP-N-acetylglucosamine 3-dehydrogenase